MAVTIKSPREIELMREAGKILAKTHDELAKNLKPGMSTWDIDHMGEEIIRSYGCIPSFKNYNGYPASICVSVNSEVVHGIPNKHRYLKEGDIVSLDAGVIYKGYHSDAARTYGIGSLSLKGLNLQKPAIISMISQVPFRNMRKALGMAWSATWWAMESGHIFTRTRRFRTFPRKGKGSCFAPA